MPFPAAFGLPALPAHPPPLPWVLSSALPAPFIIKPSPCSYSSALLASAPVSGRPFFPGHYLAVPDARCTCCCTSLWPTSGTRRLACCLCATVCRQCAAPPVPLHNICLSAAVCFVT
ncbi:hypothetical protein COCMIDRAFT_40390 [Bipolaris oryzae ATCC 44560]|uniref:Uncharacterized protein n=1 Tax=Bipolaris oryzae ATCC 44560 TaxID=930090 RepID=W6Z1C8_COCMI|nr:uncharacterized protein COCMIDRAFT_40390 [Bipolaris oryzae ATCC 44560]EUC41454.1 hypothetical protein COCMIDRAFT_40390 [Bipolaris oryzae ATCC 44560]